MSVDLKKWMSLILDGTPLATLSIPGTHQSPSLHDHEYYSDTAKCQTLNIEHQLEIGVRFFDVRLKQINANTLQAWHGSGKIGPIELGVDQKINFNKIQQGCINFLKNNPSETIFMCFGREDGDDIAPLLYSKFDQNYWKFPTTFPKTMSNDLRGKIVLVKRYSDFTDEDKHLLISYSNSSNRLFTQGVTDNMKLKNEITYSWAREYSNLTLLNSGNNYYIAGQSEGKRFFTQGIDSQMGYLKPKESDSGSWSLYYDSMCSLEVGGKAYLFAHNKNEKKWFTKEVLPNGELSGDRDGGKWSLYYSSVCSFQVGGKTYILAHNANEKKWFTKEVLPNGKLSGDRDGGKFTYYYDSLCSLQVGGETYIVGQTESTKLFFTQKVLPGGKLDDENTYTDTWNHYYKLCPIQLNGKAYLASLRTSKNPDDKYDFYINEINSNGTVGGNIFHQGWNQFYENLLFMQRNAPFQPYGISLSEGWANNNKDFTINLPNSTKVRIQDRYNPRGDRSACASLKADFTEKMIAYSSRNTDTSLFTLNFASGVFMKRVLREEDEVPQIFDPVAKYVNPRLKRYLGDNNKSKTGFLLFDYIDEGLSKSVIETTLNNLNTGS